MNYISLEYPYLILLLIPILYCMHRCREHIKPRYFVHLHLWSAKKGFVNFEHLLKVLIFLLLCIAIASPITVDKVNPLNRHGKDILLAIDASGSMNASGFDREDEVSKGERLTRFEITKVIASDFIHKRESDNVGVVIFGDFAFIASPITYEKEIVVEMLSYFSSGATGQNTAIGDAVAMGVRAFKHSHAKSKIMILLTDGEHNSGEISPKEAAKLAQDADIKIYTIGMGSRGEADEALLQKIAKESGGAFFSAYSAKELKRAYEEIDAMESSKIKSRDYLVKDFYYWVLLLFALTVLLYLLYIEAKK